LNPAFSPEHIIKERMAGKGLESKVEIEREMQAIIGSKKEFEVKVEANADSG
jgi:hypothetical protein